MGINVRSITTRGVAVPTPNPRGQLGERLALAQLTQHQRGPTGALLQRSVRRLFSLLLPGGSQPSSSLIAACPRTSNKSLGEPLDTADHAARCRTSR
jgi:hypothetical protein